ncbi:hypothetical protein [Prauserella cavernicola]|uniref:Uncharacterized protein n=1 Tax=Prauserella cavernicola TaxID=2800127 RepID=A0A934QMC1_9PSEU|nr:hypothetical protein [Prauserella cavernicola]MBK1784432.1 hypothetical protein [Prauserella cavernicola]
MGEMSRNANGDPYAAAPFGFFPLYPALVAAVADLPGVSTAAAGFFVSAVAGVPHAKPRFMLVGAFVLLIPVAVGLVRRRTSTQLAALALFVLGGAWFSAHALAVWEHAI